MTWGVELWDRTQDVATHVDKGIDGCEKLRSFLKERCQIETEYATRLKKLIKSNLVVPKKGKSVDDELPFTWQKALQGLLGELSDLATQHERLVELLQESSLKPLEEAIRGSKDGRKKVMNEVNIAESKYKQSKKQLDATQDRYRKAFAASTTSDQNHERAERDPNLSRANVDKFKADMLRKRQECDDAKKDYAAQLERTNEDQRLHFDETIPSLMNQLEEFEVKRITAYRDCLVRANESEKDALKIMVKCTEGIDSKVAIIDPKRDNQLALDTMKTGYRPPEAFPFEELSINNPTGGGPRSGQVKDSLLKRTRSTSKAPIEAQRNFSHLPPNQQRNEINKKLGQLRDEQAKKTKELDGVQKLEQTYRQNSKLGNPDVLREQMGAINKLIEGLNAEIREYEGYLQEAEARLGSVRSTLTDGGSQKLSISAASGNENRATVHSAAPATASAPVERHSTSPSHAVRAQSTIDDEFDDQQPPVGKALALYAYDANDASALSIQANEVLYVIEDDAQNSGWTRVRRTTTADEGYVPTAYLKIELF